MAYIIDTNIFRKMLEHMPRKGVVFESIWDSFEEGINTGNFISVDECMNEMICHYSDDNENLKWIKNHREMFLNPTNDESLIIRQIFTNKKMQESIHSKNILNNRPSADVYIAAKAKAIGAIVVTAEDYKPHSAQLPNICELLDVECISYDEFMEIVTSNIASP